MKSKIFLFLTPLVLSIICACTPGVVSSSPSSWLSDPVIRAWYADYLADSLDYPVQDVSLVPLAKTRNGTIRGQVRYSGTTKILRWLGVPYAAAPVGDLRFKAPQPYQGWGSGNYQATRHPNACPQFRTNLTAADENCLYLSIYSRRKSNSAENNERLLPVIYFIHGGGYAFGQNSIYTGAKLLANEEVVLVTVQYRLGPLGFFSTGDDTVSSNNAMKDMVQGLRYVQENIAAFGGDPTQVTIMGESAGSASALYMLISPLAQGLFHRVVAMSGTPLQEWAIDRNPWESAKRLGALLNCSTESSSVLVECLRKVDWLPLTQAGLGVIMEDFQNFKIFLHGTTPVVEGNVPGAFLPDDPLKLLLEGPLPSNVSVMLGTVQHEGILPLAGAHFLVLNPEGLLNDTEYMQDYLLGDLLKTYGVNERQDGASISQSMALAFLSPEKDRTNFTEIQYELLDMLSAVFMKAPVLRTADILSRRLPAVYLYSFEYYSNGKSLYNLAFNMIQLIIGGEKPPMKPGICHADDLIYMFNLPFVLTVNDLKFSKSYVELFTNFAVHGNPTPEATDAYPIWPKYDSRSKHYMKLDLPFEAKRDFTASWRQGMPGA